MPILWESTQTLLQLIVSFNLAYFIFVSISTSVADKALDDLKDARAELDEFDKDINLINEAKLKNKWRGDINVNALRNYYNQLHVSIRDADNRFWDERGKDEIRRVRFGFITAIIGTLFTVLLVYATFNAKQPVQSIYIWISAIIGILPVFVLLILNISAFYIYHELRNKFFSINVSAGTALLNLDAPGTDVMDTVGMQLFLYKQKG